MNREVVGSLAWAGGIIALALAATLARQQGYIDTEMATRLVLGATGLMVAWYGNQMPKRFVPSERARQVTRVGGWSLALSGLVYAGLWAFAPFDVALIGGCGAIILGIAVTVGYCLSVRDKAKAV
ncbi:ammonium transporter [Brevundimonas sp.]|uniref:ammonium transporter n=1 Tax=Brevundimonas sp. TaxID=1871086 RepID=UPI002D251BAB|nr:ammonium transporter [Brevundimonas sp.]HYC74005.1 ammonium transporter [Brevundimonas sp.]